jgi:CRISPR system Cascade subunit CasC
MSRFLQIHALTFFPPANMNRDDTGRPKTAIVGGTTRLRLSSQALKRAWRTSPAFSAALEGHMGQRTQRLGEVVLAHLVDGGMPHGRAIAVARDIAGVFGKVKDVKDDKPARTEQLAFISPEERTAALALADRALAGETIDAKAAGLLRTADTAADIALFGRMLADSPSFNREAAAQVAHAITTHKVTIEDDYYTAVDDLNTPKPGGDEDAGAAFLGEAAFGSGVFYQYACVDRPLLLRNIGGDKNLAATALGALARAVATVAPRGKQNSFAAHGRASYILAERGDQQPRTLAVAFARAVTGVDLMAASIQALKAFRNALDDAYDVGADRRVEMEVGGEGSLADIVAFVRGDEQCPAT